MNFMILPESVCFNYYFYLVQQFRENNSEKSSVWALRVDNTSSNKIPVDQQMCLKKEGKYYSKYYDTSGGFYFFIMQHNPITTNSKLNWMGLAT